MVACVVLAGCAVVRRPPLSPSPERIADSRARLAVAAADRDVPALRRLLAPGAVLTLGRDTFALDSGVAAIAAGLPADAALELWFEPANLRACARWAYESGGRLGFLVYTPGRPVPRFGRYRVALAWTADSAGNALVHAVALIPTVDPEQPHIADCRPTPREQFRTRSVGLVVVPGAGYAPGNTLNGVEAGLRARSQRTRVYGDVAGYPEPGQSRTPLLAAAWVRVWRGVHLEAVTSLETSRMATSGFDSVESSLAGVRLAQKWTAGMVAVRWSDFRVGAGPTFVREAWRVSVEQVHLEPGTARPVLDAHVASAGSTRNRAGVFTQAAWTMTISTRVHAEVRGYMLSLAPSLSPHAFGLAPIKVSTSRSGLGLSVGVSF